MAFEQTVESDDAHAARKQYFGTNAANVSCCSSNENIQWWVLLEQGLAQDLVALMNKIERKAPHPCI